jgi:hypothetical protein
MALVVGVFTECLVLVGLRLWFGNLFDTLDVWFALGWSFGAIAGGAAYWRTLAVLPLRPQRHLGAG